MLMFKAADWEEIKLVFSAIIGVSPGISRRYSAMLAQEHHKTAQAPYLHFNIFGKFAEKMHY